MTPIPNKASDSGPEPPAETDAPRDSADWLFEAIWQLQQANRIDIDIHGRGREFRRTEFVKRLDAAQEAIGMSKDLA